MKKKLTEEQREALAGEDSRPGRSRMTDSYIDAVCPPEVAKMLKDARAKSKPKADAA